MLKATPTIVKSSHKSSGSAIVAGKPRTPEEEARYNQRCEDLRIASFDKQCRAFLELTCHLNLVKINAIIKEAAAEHFGSQAEADRLFAADRWGLYTEVDRQKFTPRSLHNFEPDWLFECYIDEDDEEDEWTVEKRRAMDWPEQLQMKQPSDDQDENLEQRQKRMYWRMRLLDDIIGGNICEYSLREMVVGAADRNDEKTAASANLSGCKKRMDAFRVVQNKLMKQHLNKIETAAIDIACTRVMKHLFHYPESSLLFQRKIFTGAKDVLAEYM